MTSEIEHAELDPRRWWTLPVLCLSLLLVVVTNGTVYTALPSIARDLDASASELQWIVDAYALVFAGLLLPAGSLGDRFGRKGTLQLGLAWFACASLLGTIATEPVQLIAVRAAMGAGAAFVMPSTLSILANIFPAHERPRAIALWAGVAGVGGILGPLMTGLVLEHFWWGSAFFINAPIVAVALVLGAFLVPTSRDPHPRRLDPMGAALSAGSLGLLLFGVIEAPDRGWDDPVTITTLVAALLAGIAFVRWELRTREPMLELRLFRNARFSMGAFAIALSYFTIFGLSLLGVQYLQQVRGLSPLAAGLRTAAVGVVLILLAPRSARIAARFGTGRTVAVGLTIMGIGMALFATLRPETGDTRIIVAYTIIGVGMAITTAPSTNAIMGAVPRENAGMGSAVNDTTREVGGSIGIAVMGTVLALGYRAALRDALVGLPPDIAESADASIAGASDAARQLGGDAGIRLLAAANDAYCDGLRLGGIAVAVVSFVGAVLAWRLLPAADAEVRVLRSSASPDPAATSGSAPSTAAEDAVRTPH